MRGCVGFSLCGPAGQVSPECFTEEDPLSGETPHPAQLHLARRGQRSLSVGNPISRTEKPSSHSLETKGSPPRELVLDRDGGRRPGAVATESHLDAQTGHVLASPELHCASRLHSQEEYAPCRLHHAPVAGSSPSVGKLISRIVESLARSSEPAVEP